MGEDHSFITLEEASLVTGKSIHTLRKTVKSKNIPTKKMKQGSRLMLMVDKQAIESHYQSKISGVKQQLYKQKTQEYDDLKEQVSYLKDQVSLKDREIVSKNNQIARKDQQIMQLHVLVRTAQKQLRYLIGMGKKKVKDT